MKGDDCSSDNMAFLTVLDHTAEEGQEAWTWRRKCSAFFINFGAELIPIPKIQFYSKQAF